MRRGLWGTIVGTWVVALSSCSGGATGAPDAGPACVMPASVDFGGVAAGSVGEATLVLTNPLAVPAQASVGTIVAGAAPGTITWAASSPQGAVGLDGGASVTLIARFAPTAVQHATATAVLRLTEGCPEVTVSLVGEGVDPVLDWSPSTVDFGTVTPPNKKAVTVTFSNVSFAPVVLSAMDINVGSLPKPTFMIADAGAPLPDGLIVPAGHRDLASQQLVAGTADLTLIYGPWFSGSDTALFKATTSLSSQTTIAIPLKGVAGP